MNDHDQPLQTLPIVYLDQWVWIRLARAALGRPREPGDEAVLHLVRTASDAGVVFPLSTVHYMETAQTTDPRQRRDLAAVMLPISRCQALRGGRVLMRHQMLTAMHESFGRPAFRPRLPDVIGVGAVWAFRGKPGHLELHGPTGVVTPTPELERWLRRANQWVEAKVLAGPEDAAEVADLRTYGYQPEAALTVAQSRLEWEQLYVDLLHDDPVAADELRVRVQARELIHEHLDLFTSLLAEYGLSLSRALGISPARRGSRARMTSFADSIPSMRVAVDVKTHLFRDTNRPWKMNDLHDIDALSLAVPYCRALVADAHMADKLRRSGVERRHNVRVLHRLDDLATILPSLTAEALKTEGDRTDWDAFGHGGAYRMRPPDQLPSLEHLISSPPAPSAAPTR